MAYPNSYFPVGYQPYQPQPQMQMQQPQQQNHGIIWVDGENSARSYMLGAGQSVMLMDSNASCFYIKTADQSGMPLPLRVFDYTERTVNQPTEQPQIQQHMPDYITREEFEKRIAELMPKKPASTRKETAS